MSTSPTRQTDARETMPDDPADPVLDYMPAGGEPRRRFSVSLVDLGVTMIILILLVLIQMPRGPRGDSAPRVKCAANLRMIGQALQIYFNDFGAYPPSLTVLADAEELPMAVFQCPILDEQPPTLKDLQAHPGWLTDPAHISYTYTPPPTTQPHKDDIVAFETIDHKGDGSNVLFGDGSVHWIPANQMTRLRQIHAAGVRLPREPGGSAP